MLSVFDEMNVFTTFLYILLNEVIFMQQSQDFLMKDMVCRLIKLLYNLKRRLNQWNKRVNYFMRSQGFLWNVYDTCVYLKKIFNVEFGLIILVLYVDEMLIAALKNFDVDKCKAQLSSTFNMKYVYPIKKIFDTKLFWDQKSRKLWLSQQKYAEKMLVKFNIS